MKRFLFGAALALTVFLVACDKDKEVPCVTNNDTLADFTRRHAPAVQVFEVDSSTRSQTFRTAGGAWLDVYHDGFVRPDGTTPTGSIKVYFQEIYSASDMLLANVLPIRSNGSPLISGGEFNIKVMEGNVRLQRLGRWAGLRLNSPIPARLTVADTARMYQWVRDSSFWRWDIDNTGPFPSIIPIPSGVRDSVNQRNPVYSLSWLPDSMGWINIDAPLTTGLPRTAVIEGISPAADPDTRCYFIINRFNGAVWAYWNPQTNRLENTRLTDGLDLTAVVLRIKGGKYYFGSQRAILGAGVVYRPSLREVSEDELVRLIKAL